MRMNEENICPVCGENALKQVEYSLNLEFKGSEYTVDGFRRSVCESCESEVTNPDQSLHNKRVALEARKRAENLLSGLQIRAIRQGYNLTQQQAATIFGGGPVAFSKYEKGDVVQSASMDRLLRVVEAVPAAYYWLVDYVASTTGELKLEEVLGGTDWKFQTETILEITENHRVKKGRALHTQYVEMPFFYETTLAANGNVSCPEKERNSLIA